jgi:hypothetical protein
MEADYPDWYSCGLTKSLQASARIVADTAEASPLTQFWASTPLYIFITSHYYKSVFLLPLQIASFQETVLTSH